MLQCMKTEASNYAYSAPWKLPAKDYRRFIEDLAAMIPDPVKKLKFLNQVMGSYQKMPFYSKLCPPVAEAAARKIIIEKAKQYCPECLADNHEFIQKYGAEPRLPHVWSSLRQHNIFKSSGLLLFIWCIGLLVTSFAAILHSDYSSDMKTAYTEKGVFHSIIYPSGIPQGKTEGTGIANHSDHQNNPEQLHAYATEKTPDHNKIVTLPEPIAGMYFAYVHDIPHGRYQRFNVYSAYIPDDGVQLPAYGLPGEVCFLCITDQDCDDGVFCNGEETCDVGSGVCQPATNPCPPDDGLYCNGVEGCDEDNDVWVTNGNSI